MNHEQAHALATGYAWACEDITGTPTFGKVPVHLGSQGVLDFADAYADAQDTFNNGQSRMSVPVREAYESWQKSEGGTLHHEFRPSNREKPTADRCRDLVGVHGERLTYVLRDLKRIRGTVRSVLHDRPAAKPGHRHSLRGMGMAARNEPLHHIEALLTVTVTQVSKYLGAVGYSPKNVEPE